MEHTPLVSIILPTYNRQDLLPKAVESVLTQTYPNWELIIWDDGSFDDTEMVALSFKEKEKRIDYYRDDNHGKSYALNNAIRKSRADYISFLDDDDQWVEQKLSHQMELLISNPQVDLIFGNFTNINLTTGEAGLGFEQSSSLLEKLGKEAIGGNAFFITDNFLECISRFNFIASDTVIVRRRILDQVGDFNENLRNAEDFEYWWRVALAGGRFAYTNEILLTRVKPAGSLSSPSILTYENKIQALDSCLQEIVSKGRKDLIPFLKYPYGNAWLHIMLLCGYHGDTTGVFKAFLQSVKYGFSPGLIRMLFESIGKSIKK